MYKLKVSGDATFNPQTYLNKQKDRANDALKAERERQQQAKATERVQKAQQALTKAGLP